MTPSAASIEELLQLITYIPQVHNLLHAHLFQGPYSQMLPKRVGVWCVKEIKNSGMKVTLRTHETYNYTKTKVSYVRIKDLYRQ